MRTPPRRALPTLFAAALVVSACGGSDDDSSDTDVASVETDVAETDPTEPEPAETDPPADTAAPAETDPPADTAAAETAETAETAAPAPTAPAETTAPAPTDSGEPADTGDTADTAGAGVDLASGTVEASLVEWGIAAPDEYAAGEITFDLTNDGEFPHEFVVIEGESYESLPLAEGGAVIEDQLPTGALIDRVPRFGPGESASLTVDLAPGSYVLVCNLGSGVNSHAGAGQRLDITVS